VVAAYDSDGEHPTSAVVVANPTISQWAYYRFNENSGTRAIDNWGGNHAVLSTTATRNAGYEGQALVLDGAASSYATLPGGVLRNLNDFTISTWVKMDALATWMRIFDFGSGTNQYMFLTPQAGVTSGQSIIRYAIKNGGSEQTVNFNYTWPLDTWTHIAITQSGNTCRLYLNGVLVATNTNINIKPAALDSTTQNYLGKSQFAADPMLKGRIDEVKMYSRALSSAEIVAGMKAEQIITFDAIPAKRVGDADFAVTASASSGLQLTYSSSDTAVATVDTTGLIHITGAGATIITTSQYGNAVYDTAVAFQPFTVQNLDIQVQHMDGDNGLVANNSIRPYLKIVNKDSIPVAYQELTVRYWFTAENYAGINTWIDYAQLGNNVKMKYVALPVPRNGAFGYLEYRFETAAGNLPAGGNSGVIQSRGANTNWAVFAETDDYSYAPNATYTANSKITLYRNGRLVWGSEPVEVIPTVNLKVYAQSINSSQNTISNYLKINNEGNMPVDYSDISVRYWFTAEGTSALNYWTDYAQLGASRISGRFTRLSPVRDSADTYLEITVDTTMGALFPLSTTGNIQYRITKSDWSAFISNNDFSWMAPTSTFNENSRITIHYKGELIWGREPAGMSDAATMRSIAVMNNDLPETGNILVYPNPVADILHIRIGKPEKDGWISIYNNSGMLVHSERLISGTQNIPVTRLVPGIYHVQIRNGKAVTVKKIIKE
jgi:hypothetical protein